MQSLSYFRLNCDEVKRQIGNQDLKRWWVAEQAGVHKSTLRRWLSGEIHKVRWIHITDLARVLTVNPTQIAEPFGSRSQLVH